MQVAKGNDSKHRRRRWRRLSIRLSLSMLVGLIAFEVLARLVFPGFRITYYWAHHPVLGWTQVPNGRSHHEVAGETVWVGVNSAGFHDVEHDLERPRDVRRIVLIGDSFSEAVQVNLENTFFRRLEAKLCTSGPDRWEVINLGVGDFGTAQASLALDHLGFAYDPDVVLVQVFPLNDICNNAIDLCDACGSNNDRFRPYYVQRDGHLELTSIQPLRNFFRQHSISYVALEAILFRIAGGQRSDAEREAARRQRGSTLGFHPDGLEPLFQTYCEDVDQHPAIREGWHVTETILEGITERCRERGISVLPIVIPWDQRVGDAWQKFANGKPPPRIVQDYPERRLAALFSRLDVPCLLMKPIFEQQTDWYLPLPDGHLSAKGHRITADAIYGLLQSQGMLER